MKYQSFDSIYLNDIILFMVGRLERGAGWSPVYDEISKAAVRIGYFDDPERMNEFNSLLAGCESKREVGLKLVSAYGIFLTHEILTDVSKQADSKSSKENIVATNIKKWVKRTVRDLTEQGVFSQT